MVIFEVVGNEVLMSLIDVLCFCFCVYWIFDLEDVVEFKIYLDVGYCVIF